MIIKLFDKLSVNVLPCNNDEIAVVGNDYKIAKVDEYDYKIPYYAVDCKSGLVTIGYYRASGIGEDITNDISTDRMEPEMIIPPGSGYIIINPEGTERYGSYYSY